MSLNNKINIAYISRTSNLTGAEKITLDLVKALNKDKFKPIVFLPDNKGVFYDELTSSGIDTRIIEMPFLRITYNPFSLMKFFINIIVLNRKFKKIFENENIKIVSCNTIHEALFIFRAVSFLKLKLIICFKNILDKKWKKKIRAKFCSKFAARIIAVSKKAELDYTWFTNSKKENSVVINDSIDYKDYLNGFKSFEINYPGKNNLDFIIVNIGSIQELKGQLMLLQAINSDILKNYQIKVFLVGEIYHKNDTPYKLKIIDFIKENALENKVFMPGYQKDVRNYLSFSDLFVHCPVIDDAFPRVILEAFCLGKITLATRTGGIPEMIEDGFNGYLSEIDKNHLAEKIEFIYKNRDKLSMIKENALNSVKDKFSLKTQVRQTEDIYFEILGKERNR